MPEVKTKIESTFKTEKEDGQLSSVPYTGEESAYRSYLIRRLTYARDQRESEYMEFNDQNYTDWYDGNARAANAYNPPKVNKEDSRIVTGLTLEKEQSLLSAVLNYNLEPNVTAFNKQTIKINEIGEVMEDLIGKSREMEHYHEKRPSLYKELFDQGTCYVEEVKKEYIRPIKTMKTDWRMGGVNTKQIKWDRKLEKLYSSCEVNLLEGKKVYLGNMREFFLENQPYAFYADIISYDEAKYLYGDWDRWEHVPNTIVKFDRESLEQNEYRDWSLLEQQPGFVEVIKYQDPLNNEFMIMLNGVMMLPIEFPLTAISPSGRFSFAKGDAEIISRFFAISRSIPSKTKVDQGVLDETLRLLILMMQQTAKPALANKSNKVLSRKVFYPGTVTNGLNPEDIGVIGPQNTINNGAVQMYDLLKNMIDSKSVSATFAGETSQKGTTATEIQEVKKQQMMKLGAAMIGVISLERQLAELRLYNLLATWTEKVDERVDDVTKQIKGLYRTVSMDTTLENGQKGERIVSFDPEMAKMRTSDEVKAMEDYMKKKMGRNVRFNFIDAELIKKIVSTWFITITPTERDSSELDRVMFVTNLQQAAQLFGPQSINMEYAKERFATLGGEDPEKFFTRQSQNPMMAPEQGKTSLEQQIMKAGGAQQPNKLAEPSLSQLQPAQ